MQRAGLTAVSSEGAAAARHSLHREPTWLPSPEALPPAARRGRSRTLLRPSSG